jgi:predicted transcriptional regulator
MAIKSLQVHVDDEVHKMVAAIKKQRKVSREQVIVDAITEAFKKHTVKEQPVIRAKNNL